MKGWRERGGLPVPDGRVCKKGGLAWDRAPPAPSPLRPASNPASSVRLRAPACANHRWGLAWSLILTGALQGWDRHSYFADKAHGSQQIQHTKRNSQEEANPQRQKVHSRLLGMRMREHGE